MEIKQEKLVANERFYIEEDNNTLAEMVYHFIDKTIFVITHTEVDESLEGKGIGRKLVVAAVDYARKNSLIIKATCPFAKKVLDRTPEFADVYNAEKNN
ncbi:MAG TPA: GNAT family N-acetyltransferase [Chitinophagaceae bacterium]